MRSTDMFAIPEAAWSSSGPDHSGYHATAAAGAVTRWWRGMGGKVTDTTRRHVCSAASSVLAPNWGGQKRLLVARHYARHVVWEVTKERPAAPLPRLAAGSDTASRSADTRDSGSSGRVNQPRSDTSSGIPPTAVAMQGSPIAIASSSARGTPSERELRTNASAAARNGRVSDCSPARMTVEPNG